MRGGGLTTAQVPQLLLRLWARCSSSRRTARGRRFPRQLRWPVALMDGQVSEGFSLLGVVSQAADKFAIGRLLEKLLVSLSGKEVPTPTRRGLKLCDGEPHQANRFQFVATRDRFEA
jgi:hypothetical protein